MFRDTSNVWQKRMRLVAYAGVLVVFVSAIVSCAPTRPENAQALTRDVFVEELEQGLWRHVSHKFMPPAGQVPSNGLVIELPSGALVVDTAWNDEQTATLLNWVEEHVGFVKAVIVTHAHDDRMGGIEEVHRRGIPTYGLEATSTLAKAQGLASLTNTFGPTSKISLAEFGVAGEIFYPGPGHTPDNIVVWLEASQTLFGTCMVRAADWGIGNLADAMPKDWLVSATVLVERYAAARRVVPGHGDIGGGELLTRTRLLVEEIQ